ncbi:MAG: aldo/keto reductase [Clostridiales bacterium]|jgi:aryl-alcohol dehydrogenase-like predicted oxidoreductase|nr:aldo/keto reductase [Clostridiales bacterium]
MDKRALGRTGMNVSRITMGGMATEKMDQALADKVFNTALDRGINIIDTSPEYPNSELLIGRAVSHRRKEFFIATKCGDHEKDYRRWTRENFIDNLNSSLKLLKTDYIDLWEMHGLAPGYLKGGENDETIEYMKEVQREGKIRHIGVTFRNGNPTDDQYPGDFSYNAIKEYKNWEVFSTFQVVYGCLTRQCEKAISEAAEKGKGIFARGNFRNYFPWYHRLFEDAKLYELFDGGEDKSSFMLRFALSHPDIDSIVIGSSNPVNIVKNALAADKGALKSDVYEEAKRRLAKRGAMPK